MRLTGELTMKNHPKEEKCRKSERSLRVLDLQQSLISFVSVRRDVDDVKLKMRKARTELLARYGVYNFLHIQERWQWRTK